MTIMLAISLGLMLLFISLPAVGMALGVPWLALVVSYALIPLVDHVVGAPSTRSRQPIEERAARWIPRAYVPLHFALLIGAVIWAPSLAWSDLLWFALAVGNLTGGLGITVAHELGHRASKVDRALSKLLLVSVAYGHFYVEHNRGHHVRVATPEDPATARRGQTVYGFWWQSVVGSWRHAWRLERLRLERAGRSAWSAGNWVLLGAVATLALAAGAWLMGAANGLALFAIQAIAAFSLLEVVNYIEHYGLQRRRVANGRYEPVTTVHSWNANYAVSNFLLFNLQLHSDHHMHVDTPYERLRSMPEAPQLPTGYPALILVALFPPLWRRLIDPRLEAWSAQARA